MHSITEISTEVRAIADRLAAVPVGETVSYGDLSEALGADVRVRRYLVLAAIRATNVEAGAIFGSVRGVGYKRLPAEDAHMVGALTRRRIRRAARRAEKTIVRAVAVANTMPEEAKLRAYREISVLGMIGHLTADRTAATAPLESRPQPVAHTMRALLAAIGADGAEP